MWSGGTEACRCEGRFERTEGSVWAYQGVGMSIPECQYDRIRGFVWAGYGVGISGPGVRFKLTRWLVWADQRVCMVRPESPLSQLEGQLGRPAPNVRSNYF